MVIILALIFSMTLMIISVYTSYYGPPRNLILSPIAMILAFVGLTQANGFSLGGLLLGLIIGVLPAISVLFSGWRFRKYRERDRLLPLQLYEFLNRIGKK